MNIRRLILVVLAALLLPIAAPTGTLPVASAFDGYFAVHNQGDSDAWLDVRLQQSGTTWEYEYNLLPGHTAGQPSYEEPISQAHSWYLRVGWCAKWRIDDGPIHNEPMQTISGRYIFVWQGIPNDSASHITFVKEWNC